MKKTIMVDLGNSEYGTNFKMVEVEETKTECILREIKEHETFKQSEFFGKIIYGDELKEFMGTNLNTLIIEKLDKTHFKDKSKSISHFNLLGIEYKPESKYMPESLLFYCYYDFKYIGVCGNYEYKNYKIINQQAIRDFKTFEIKDNNIYITY